MVLACPTPRPAQSVAGATVTAASIASGSAAGGGHLKPPGSDAGHSGDQEPGPGHSGALTQVCLAVLTALVLLCAFRLFTSREWTRYRPSLRVLGTPPPRDPVMWWVHPRSHVLCVMRT